MLKRRGPREQPAPEAVAAVVANEPTFQGNNIVMVAPPTEGTNEARQCVATEAAATTTEASAGDTNVVEMMEEEEATKQQATLNQKKWKTKSAMTRKYRVEWEESFKWLTCTATDVPVSFCRVCKSILSNTFTTLTTHEGSRKHVKNIQRLEVQNIKNHYTTDEFNEPDLDMSDDDDEAQDQYQSRMPKEQSEELPRKKEPTPPSPEDPNHPKVVLRNMALEMGYDAVLDSLGPQVLFKDKSIFDILQKKAMMKTKEKCMRQIGNELETLLLEAKILVENCFDLMPDSRDGRIERFRRNGAQSIKVSQILSHALDIPEGWWVQREKNNIRYTYGLECGVLTDIERLAAPPRDPEHVGVNLEEADNYDTKLAEPRAGYLEKRKEKLKIRRQNRKAKAKKPLKIKIEPGSKRFYTTAADRANRLKKRQRLTESDLDPENDEDPDYAEELYK